MIRRGALVLLVLVIAACSDIYLGVYATLDEAKREGAVERGWVPAGLPSGTTDIREGHDLDTNERWGAFMFPTAQADTLRGLIDATELHAGIECDPPGRLEWWPRVLRTPIDFDAAKTTGLRFYRSRDRQLVYAIHWAQGRAYYWNER